MKYIKVKFLKDRKPMGRTYTYKIEDDVKAGDIVKNVNGTKLMVVDESVDERWIKSFGEQNIATVEKYVAQEMVVKNWSVYVNPGNGFTAPELCSKHLQGNVYGNPKFNDGDPIHTSAIVAIEDKGDHKEITTKSGSKYSVYPSDVNPECERQHSDYYGRLRLEAFE